MINCPSFCILLQNLTFPQFLQWWRLLTTVNTASQDMQRGAISSGIQGGGDSTATGLDGVSQAVDSASSAFSTGREKSKHYKVCVCVCVCGIYMFKKRNNKNVGHASFEVPAVILLRNHVFRDTILCCCTDGSSKFWRHYSPLTHHGPERSTVTVCKRHLYPLSVICSILYTHKR